MPISAKTAAAGAALAIVAVLGGTWALTLGSGANDPFKDCRVGARAGAAQIGGPFTLLSETGETVTDREVITKPSLVYFGYSWCPDVCPIDNTRNAAAADMLDAMGYDVTPVFISVDTARDTPESLTEYTDLMSPKMIGLTGTEAQIDAAVKAYRAYYKVADPTDPQTLIDHSTQTYLMDPERGYLDFYDRDTPPEEVARSVACFIDTLKTNDK
ncbi:SCO family protein [Rhodobacter sp. TJ_12]|uniref:SCO family protein n=1 Tax=Rhodobacter sp. TJ_12 TaxID=2029399 RepID=UPI001CBC5709|nr:SCO family protein [Rhodobacter sp. TJ_12]MBZ4022096.1 SCO family protein [Rhodobacter sp. TJ_12]